MLASIAAAQPLFLALVLAWAGGYKLARRGTDESALTKLLGVQRSRLALRAVGVAELAIAALLLAPPALPWEPWPAVVLAAGFLAYLGYARLAAAEASCGCVASGTGPVTWRHFGRAGMLLLSASALTASGAHPLTTVAMGTLAIQLVILLALSPDLDHIVLRTYGRMRQRLRPHPFAATATLAHIPLHATLERLYNSPVYAANASLLRSDVQDFWDAGDWRILTFGGRARDEAAPMTIVFAVPTRSGDDIRMSTVDDPI